VIYTAIRPLLFRLDPEAAHQLTLQLIRLGAYQPLRAILQAMYAAPEKPVQAFGLTFRNPVGLAAGYDKGGIAFRGLAALGFGHVEIGTVTLRPQPGNPKPRLFRLVEDRGVINRMGFPGRGAEFVARQLAAARCPPSVVLGVNLGKSKDTPLEEAAEDYVALLRRFLPLADYLAINVSSPNTVGLRRLQGREMLEGLLGRIARERAALAAGSGGRKPVLVKLAPDLSEEELDDALEVILRTGMDGVIATNTTLGRAGLRSARREETGGLSGEPLRARSEAVLRQVVKRLDGRLPTVSAGGIMSPEDAKTRLEAGAALVQIYTGLVYAGPGLVKDILQKV
jgi:dihydroorotate dehydrogenase